MNMPEAPLRKTTHVIHLDQQKTVQHGKRPRRVLPVIVRALLPAAVLASGLLTTLIPRS